MRSILNFFGKSVQNLSKVLLVIAVFFVVINLFINLTSPDKLDLAGSRVQKRQSEEIYQLIKDPALTKTKEQKIGMGLFRGFLCGTFGQICTDNPKDDHQNFDKSLFGKMTNLIALPYANPPASGLYYVADRLQNFGFFPKSALAYEGVGFSSIRSLIPIWTIFRNTAYLVLVLFIIAIGFMIMFRMKINPQTVISVENALPRIVLSLILITFSFAIAGFLIDLMYASIVMIISLLSNLNIGDLTTKNVAEFQNRYVGGGFIQIWPYGNNAQNGANPFQVGNALVEILPPTIKTIFKGALSLGVTVLFTGLISHSTYKKPIEAFRNIAFGTVSVGGLTDVPKIILDILLFLFIFPYGAMIIFGILFTFTLLFFLFRIFFMLLTTYITILLLIIFAPVILLFETVPGKNAFGWWFKTLVAELMTFPLFATLSIIGYAIMYTPAAQQSMVRFPFLYNIDPGPFATLVGMGLILLSPNIVKMIKELMGVKGLPGGLGLGVFFGGISTVGGGAVGMVSQFGGLALGLQHLGITDNGPKKGLLSKFLDRGK